MFNLLDFKQSIKYNVEDILELVVMEADNNCV